MIDTISIEIATKKMLQKDDFCNVKEIKTKSQNSDSNQPRFQTEILVDWPDDIKATGAYLPDVRYLNYPNPNPNSGGRYSVYRVTASLPKLLYGNNIFELSGDQFEKLVNLLYSKIVFLDLPTDVSTDDIKKAVVRRVDYGKNIVLPNPASIQQLQDALAKSEHRINSRYAQVQYRSGELYREHIKARCIIVYDKLSEFISGQAYHHQDNLQKILLEAKRKNTLQVVRFEVQIQSTKQLKAELKSIGYDSKAITFEDVFDVDIARRILLKHWNNISCTIKDDDKHAGQLFNVFTEAASSGSTHCGPQKAYAKVGFSALKDTIGINAVKKSFYHYYGGNNWAYYRNSLDVRVPRNRRSAIKEVTKAIKSMKPISGPKRLYEKI